MFQQLLYWLIAIRPATLLLSQAGIIVGGLLAKSQDFFDISTFIYACLASAMYQITSNLANDYGDGVKGTDIRERLGPERMVQSQKITVRAMKMGIVVAVILSFLLTFLLIKSSFNTLSFAVFVFTLLWLASVIAAIFYTVGKYAYGYFGLGDLFVFVFFGLVAVLGSFYLQTHSLNVLVLLPAIAIGLLCVAILNVNNIRDIDTDKLAGKHTLALILGVKKAQQYHFILLFLPLLLLVVYCLLTQAWQGLLVLLFIYPLYQHFLVVCKQTGKALNTALKRLSVIIFFISLGFGFLLIF